MLWPRTPTLRERLILTMMVIALTTLLISGTAMMIYDLQTYRERGLNELAAQAEILGRATAPALAFDDERSALAYLELLKVIPDITGAAIYNAKGKLFVSYRGNAHDKTRFPALPELDRTRIEGDTIVLFSSVVENNEILGTVYMRANYNWVGRVWDNLTILTVVIVFCLLVALYMSDRLQYILTRPIIQVTDVARQVMESRDFSLRVKKSANDEIGYLIDAFNNMLAEVGRRSEALEGANRELEREMGERRHAEEKLSDLNARLESTIETRTADLKDANKEMESFSYSVSHDLRAPLRAVAGYSKLLSRDHAAQLDGEALRKLDVIQSEAHRMGVLIDDLLAFSRLGRKAIKMTELDMTGLAGSAFDNAQKFTTGSKPELRLGTLPSASGDAVLIGQVWANLLANAIKFTSKNTHAEIEVNGISDDKENVYFVRDNGVGFDPRYQSKLFGIFQRMHDDNEFPGTGIGLALVQRIINRHGGRLWAQSKPDEGATFYFALPKESIHAIV